MKLRLFSLLLAALLTLAWDVSARGQSLDDMLAQLDDLQAFKRRGAAEALALCGPRCAQGLPVIREKFRARDEDVGVRVGLAEAILRIDPKSPAQDAVAFLASVVQQARSGAGIPNYVLKDAFNALGCAGERRGRTNALLESIKADRRAGQNMPYMARLALKNVCR